MATEVGEMQIKLKFDEKPLNKSMNSVSKANESAASKISSVWQKVSDAIIRQVAVKAFDAVINASKKLTSTVVNTGMSFEKSMSEVAAITGATGSELDLLEQTARDFGASTMFSASEAADALKYMGLAGWNANQATSALGGVLDLAAASGMDLAAASDMVTDYLSAFSMEAEQSGYFADLLTYAQTNANTTAEQLGEAYKNCAANMNAAGQDVETTTAFLAMMANQSLKGSEAGTALNAIMRDMTAKMKDGAIAIGNTSVKVMEADGNYRDLTDILQDVEKATEGMGDAERAAALSASFTADSIKGMNLIMNAGVGNAASFEEALRDSGGTAAEMAAIMRANLQGQLKELNSNYEEVSLKIYDTFLPAMTSGATGMNDFVTAIGKAVSGEDVSGDVQSFIDNFSNALTTGLQQLGTIVVNVLPVLINSIVGILPSLFEGLLAAITTAIQGLAAAMPSMMEAFTTAILGIVDILTNPATMQAIIDGAVQMLMAIINAIPVFLPRLIAAIPVIISNLVNALVSNISMILEGITQIIISVVQALTDPASLQMLVQAAVDLLMGIVNAIPQILPPLIAMLPTIINNIVTFLTNSLPIILDGAVQMMMALIDSLPTIIQALAEALPTVIDAITGFLTEGNTIQMVLEAAITVFYALIDALPQIIQALAEALPNVISSVVGFLTNPATIAMLLNAAITLFFALVNAVPKILGALISSFGTLVGSLWESIKSMFGKFASNFGEFLGGIFKGAINGVLSFIESMINKPINIINGFIDLINGAFGFIGVNLGHIDTVSLPRMEYGGIVPGDSYTGDHNLIRANSGEMVITRPQQAALWAAIEEGDFGGYEENDYYSERKDNVSVVQNLEINDRLDIYKVSQALLKEMRLGV